MISIYDLSIGERGTIVTLPINIPIQLIEIGFMVGVDVKLIQTTPFNGPIYLMVNDSYFAIRKETAALIKIKNIKI